MLFGSVSMFLVCAATIASASPVANANTLQRRDFPPRSVTCPDTAKQSFTRAEINNALNDLNYWYGRGRAYPKRFYNVKGAKKDKKVIGKQSMGAVLWEYPIIPRGGTFPGAYRVVSDDSGYYIAVIRHPENENFSDPTFVQCT